MDASKITAIRTTSHDNQKLKVVIIVLVTAGLVFGASSLAFFFESPSINYKLGWDKVVLRCGKLVGLAAAMLLFLQLPIAGRIKFFDRVFSLPGLYRIHQCNSFIIGLLIVIHPALVTLSEDRLMIPFETRYWPEWMGAGLFLAVLSQIVLGRWRPVFFKKYQIWLLLHRSMGPAIFAFLIIHILYVSETFEYQGFPRNAVFMTSVVMIVLWLAVRGQRRWAKKKPFVVSGTQSVGKNARAINLKPATQTAFTYFPGQFAFFSFASNKLSSEWHPFTLASSPTRPDSQQIIVRDSGDWTRGIHRVQQNDRVFLHGPFGRFSHSFVPLDREIVMIAGGIGITPMLSMLRAMKDCEDQRRITLLWSSKTAGHLFFQDELNALSKTMHSFNWVPVFTVRQEPMGQFGRLTLDTLETLLEKCSRSSVIFLCGPLEMVGQIHRHLIALGFSRQSIIKELFTL